MTPTINLTDAPWPAQKPPASGSELLTVSVILCTHDAGRTHDIQAALHALALQTVQPAEVLLVIDHNERLWETATKLAGQSDALNVRVIANDQDPGLSGARNTGVAAATADVVAFLDDDAAPHRNWLDALRRCYEDPQTIGVSGRATPSWHANKPEWFADDYNWVVGCSPSRLSYAQSEVATLLGCNMSFRRSTLAASGGFRTGRGEIECCRRLRVDHPDMKLIYEPLAEVRHRVRPERSTFRYFQRRCYAEGVTKAEEFRSAETTSSPCNRVAEPKATFSSLRPVYRRSQSLAVYAAATSGALAMVMGMAIGLLWAWASSTLKFDQNTRSSAVCSHLDHSLIEES